MQISGSRKMSNAIAQLPLTSTDSDQLPDFAEREIDERLALEIEAGWLESENEEVAQTLNLNVATDRMERAKAADAYLQSNWRGLDDEAIADLEHTIREGCR